MTETIIKNTEAILKEAGSGLNKVVKVVVSSHPFVRLLKKQKKTYTILKGLCEGC